MKKVPPGEAAHFFSARAWSRKAGTDKTMRKQLS
jgi:hypothetical protein